MEDIGIVGDKECDADADCAETKLDDKNKNGKTIMKRETSRIVLAHQPLTSSKDKGKSHVYSPNMYTNVAMLRSKI